MSYEPGIEVLVKGKLESLFGDEAMVTFEDKDSLFSVLVLARDIVMSTAADVEATNDR